MFPKWEFDVEDTPAENIIKLMFVVKEDSPRPRKKTSEEVAAEASEEAAAKASEEVTTTVGGLTKEDIKTMFKDIADAMREGFGTCLKEIKLLDSSICRKGWKLWRRRLVSPQNGKRHHLKTLPLHLNRRSNPGCICFVSCIVWILYLVKVLMGRTRKGRAWRRIKVQMCPQLCLQMLVPRKIKLQNRALRMLDIRKRGMLLWHFAQSPYTANITARVIIINKKLYPGYNPFAPIDNKKLKELADWLKTCPHYRTPLDKKPHDLPISRLRYDANPQYFRSERMCFLDHLFAQQWRFNFKDFKDSEPDQNGLGRRLPVNYANTHWIAMWISIPKRHIVVFDSICSSISPKELDVKPTNIPPARAGDCGVYTLKYIECHALGIEFRKKYFAKANGKTMRDKMAVDIFQELPDAHEFENKDNDANLGAYEGLTVKSSGMLDDLTISSLKSLLSSDLLYLYFG
ncbi:unnamed protein product [Brassica oleracea]